MSSFYYLYVRTTIPWKLSCEYRLTNAMNRETAASLFATDLGVSSSSSRLAIFALIAAFVCFITTIMFLMNDDSESLTRNYFIFSLVREGVFLALFL
jgi:hypothetical protein